MTRIVKAVMWTARPAAESSVRVAATLCKRYPREILPAISLLVKIWRQSRLAFTSNIVAAW
eukprot:scaffold12825_cov137-Skeletonema_menzelii.AAC.4